MFKELCSDNCLRCWFQAEDHCVEDENEWNFWNNKKSIQRFLSLFIFFKFIKKRKKNIFLDETI